jgi:acetyltransferase-like isoleucine patch superfamily enzyme
MSLKNQIRQIYYLTIAILKINWIKTLYINFRTQTFGVAIQFPMIVYGKLKIYNLRGKIIIDAPIATGMIHIGKDLDHNPVSLNPIKLNICNNGILKFKGPALFSGGSTITLWGGEIIIGRNVAIGSGVQLKSESKIAIGDYTRIVALCSIMDTNVHFVKDIKTGVVKKHIAPISIGNNCWINSNSIITKGVVLPNYCITSQNSFLNKDYSKICDPHTFLAGSPAKPIAYNVQRIFDFEEEQKLKKQFENNPNLDECQTNIGFFEEPISNPNLFTLR